MKTLQIIQVSLLVLAAFFFLMGIGTTLHVFPIGCIILTIAGMQRMANTLLLFSVAVGLYLIAVKKK
jgi:hypothetical protein